MLRFLLGSLFLSSPAFAVPESNFGIVHELMENRGGFFTTAAFTGVAGAKIGYTRFGNELGPAGCLVISPGLGEASLKYLEVAYDLAQKGFAPIYVIDHRGQGASDRFLPDHDKISVRHFGDYVADFETFVAQVVLANPACRQARPTLLAHSMGGAIAAMAIEQEGRNSLFAKVVLSSPMLKIHFPSGKTEESALRDTWLACTFPLIPGFRCDDYAPGYGPYNGQSPFGDNPYTHSEVRFGFKGDLVRKWPSLQIGGPTVRWVRQAALANQSLRQGPQASRVDAPVLVLEAGDDTVVDNAGTDEFCAQAPGCRREVFPAARHELLMESDSIRDQALARIAAFLVR